MCHIRKVRAGTWKQAVSGSLRRLSSGPAYRMGKVLERREVLGFWWRARLLGELEEDTCSEMRNVTPGPLGRRVDREIASSSLVGRAAVLGQALARPRAKLVDRLPGEEDRSYQEEARVSVVRGRPD